MTTEPTVDIAEDWFGEESVDLAEALRDALDDVYADVDPEDMEDALAEVRDSMSPAEAFNFAKAMRTIRAQRQPDSQRPDVQQDSSNRPADRGWSRGYADRRAGRYRARQQVGHRRGRGHVD